MGISLLDKTVADKIAAGEVVERPASVIKELLENSIDAGASRLKISIENGGRDLIEISDNGAGMTGEDAGLAIRRFATSKISCWEDLENLGTFGFRGEALPSIAAVSRMEILTRPHGSLSGSKVIVEGGELLGVTDAPAPPGTVVRVRDLFYNTPARRKFLKSPASETAHIIGIAQKLSLVNPDLAVRMESNGREIFDFPESMTLKERILKIWGLPLNYPVIPVEDETGMVRVSGFICPPDHLKSHRSNQLFFVNRRFIKNTMMNQAVSEGFSPLISGGKFPLALIIVDMPGSDVDINVHPNKMEVRFLQPGSVFKGIREAIRRELKNNGYSRRDDNSFEAPSFSYGSFSEKKASVYSYSRQGSSVQIVEKYSRPSSAAAFVEELALPDFTAEPAGESDKFKAPASGERGFIALAQLHDTYIIGMWRGEYWIIDQHTAHERINFEKLSHMAGNRAQSQRLLFPLVLETPLTLYNYVQGKLKHFEDLGFEIEVFGGSSIVVKAIPYGLNRLEKIETLMEILEESAEGHPHRNLDDFLHRLRSTIACKASVKAGDPLSQREMESLINELIVMDYANFCPHGRPVMIRLSVEFLEKLFHRR